MSDDDRLLAYLSDELDPAERKAFEARLAKEPALRDTMAEWQAIAQAHQLTYNAAHRDANDAAFLRALDDLHAERSSAPPVKAPDAGQLGATPQANAKASPTDATTSAPSAARATAATSPSRLRRLWRWIWPESSGPMMPLGWTTAAVLAAVLIWQPVAPPTEPVLTRGADGQCARLHVDLPDTITASQLRDVLTQYAVSVVSGPDAKGYFILAAHREASLHSAATALGAATTLPLPASACPSAQP